MALNTFITRTKLLILAGIILAYTLTGFFLVPFLAKKTLTQQLSTALDRPVSIEKVSVNPYTLSATIHFLKVMDKDQKILCSADRLYGNVSILSLFTFTLVVSDIQMDAPYVNIIRNEDNRFNFSDLLKKSPPKQEPPSEPKPLFRFVLKKAGITGGKADFQDNTNDTSHVLEDLSVGLLYLSSKHENRFEKTQVNTSCVINQAPVDLVVESMPFTPQRATKLNITVTKMDLLHYLAYLEIPQTLLVNDIDFNCNLQVEYKNIDQKNQVMVKGDSRVSNLDIATFENQPVLKASQMTVTLASSDALNGVINISALGLDGLDVNISRDETGQLDLLNHLPKNENSENASVPKDAGLDLPFVLNVKDFQVRQARLALADFSNPKEFKTTIYPLNVNLANLNVQETISGQFSFDLESDQKEKIASKGNFNLFPLAVKGTLDLSDIAFVRYAPYFEQMVDFNVKNGHLDLSSEFDVSQKESALSVKGQNKAFTVKNLVITGPDSKQEWVNVPQISITGSVFDLEDKTIETGTIASARGKILVQRDDDGQINFIKSIRVQKESKQETAAGTAAGTVSDVAGQAPFGGWKINLNRLDFSDYTLAFDDEINIDTAHFGLSKMNIKVDQLKTFGEKSGTVSARMAWNQSGFIRANGKANLADLSAGLNLDIGKIDIKSLQPYFTDKIKVVVTKGDIHTKGKLALDLLKKEDQIKFSGKSSITDFICLDKETSNDFLKYKSLYLSQMEVSTAPMVVNIKDISLTDFYSRIIVSDTGVVNLSSIFKDKALAAPKNETPVQRPEEKSVQVPEEKTAQAPRITIANVTLQGGDVSFSDYLTRPNFTANMKQIAGSVIGLSSEQQSRAQLNLQGLHGQSSPLEITGQINPLAVRKFFDIVVSYQDIELVNFTPYSSKYLGYKIEKGKLILDLEYLIDGPSLKSQNRAKFVNFDLGESVESEHATALPVALAVSLLKDSDGQINLDLPVTGELDDPEFSIGSIVLDMITNLIVKVATSPFSIIGAMFGGGEDLAYVDFEFGRTDIAQSDHEKIDTLIEILEKKSSVNLEIQGGYHPEKDAQALREKGYYDLIKAEKLQQMMKSKKASGSLKEITLTPEEEKVYTQIAYAKATFPKPRDSEGAEKEVTTQEKKKLLMTHLKVSKDDLRLLAMNRSKQIKAYILASEKIEKGRIFLIEPEPADPDQNLDAGRVNFLLK